ncbi:MAG: Tetrapartite efflux system component, FusD-like =_ FusD of FusABCDE system [uncultured Caballeronia sp.]|nr:MAG: Tetrapartite efflux system component, FusD-like => FusD of FusABCDE system [uncultured Caballeronia sp.]
MQALHHVARLFDRPTPRRFDAALSATTLAIDDLRAQLDTVRERCEERHRLQRMSSYLHFIRTALFDPQSPLGHLNSRPKERPMPRDIAILDAYVPTILLLFIAGGLLTWFIDRLLALTGLYRVVWHPSLFRACLFVCSCGLLGLAVYR